MSQAPLTGQPRLWTSPSTGPGMANSALVDRHARQTFQLAQSPLPRALADGHARCSRPRESLCFCRRPAQRSRTDTRDKLFSGHSPTAKSARGRTCERLKAPGILCFCSGQHSARGRIRETNTPASTVSPLRALADGHARCSRPRRLRAERRIHRAPRLWTGHSTRAPVWANLALADGHARKTFAGTARRTHPAQSARGRAHRMLKASGFA